MSGNEPKSKPDQGALASTSLEILKEEPDIANKMEDSSETQRLAARGDEASRLQALQADVRDQDDLERDIGMQVCLMTGLLL